MSGAILNSRFLTRPLTSGEEDVQRVFTLKEDTVQTGTACGLTMLILSISVNIQCDLFDSYVMTSCEQRWPIQSCSFYKVVH